MDVGGDDKMYEIHNLNSSRSQEHLGLSADNEHFESALSEGWDLKIDFSQCKSTCKSIRIFPGLEENTQLRGAKGTAASSVRSVVATKGNVNNSYYFINNVIEEGGKREIGQPKNEILSRTLSPLGIRNLVRISFYILVVCLMLNAGFSGVESVSVQTRHRTALISVNKELANNNRTLSEPGTRNGGRASGSNPWLGHKHRKHHHHHQQQQQQQQQQQKHHHRHHQNQHHQKRHHENENKKPVNKNCKEYDVTSRAFLSDLVFEGTARSRSRRASGRYVTFVVQQILKQKNNFIRPKTQIRLHFGGKRMSRRLSKINPLHDCPLNSISNGHRAMANLKVGDNYYVFADQFGLMNYTARGDPIVVNARNLKSIRSVLTNKKERPPRVLGLKEQNLKTTQTLRLECQVRGRPVPRINWYKDGASLIPSPRVNITYYRRNSTVEIKSLNLEDGGLYECRATSVTGKTAKMSAQINVWKPYVPSTEDPEKPFPAKKCSINAYCLNGGQCYFIEHLGEHLCECEAGYKGARCEVKDVSSGIKSYVCGFNIGFSSYYC